MLITHLGDDGVRPGDDRRIVDHSHGGALSVGRRLLDDLGGDGEAGLGDFGRRGRRVVGQRSAVERVVRLGSAAEGGGRIGVDPRGVFGVGFLDEFGGRGGDGDGEVHRLG